MVSEIGVKNIQAAAYNGARTVVNIYRVARMGRNNQKQHPRKDMQHSVYINYKVSLFFLFLKLKTPRFPSEIS